jgi:hypothetical protein
MRKFIKEVDSLLQNMYLTAQDSAVKFNKKQQNILSKLGINDFAKLPKAWTWMSNRPESNFAAFSHCLFKKDYPYTADLYARLLGEQAFRRLENWMIEGGYKRFDIYNVTASDCKLSLTYANPLWGGDPPSGGFEYKIRHTGISASGYSFCWTKIDNDLTDQLIEMLAFMDKFAPNITGKCKSAGSAV